MRNNFSIVLKSILIITIIIGIGHTMYNAILIYNDPTTSFPWTTALYIPGMVYLIFLALETIIYAFLKKYFTKKIV